jgi:hypothetical protein
LGCERCELRARTGVAPAWSDASLALGPVTAGQLRHRVPRRPERLANHARQFTGSITLHFANPIRNFSGADFVIFEKRFVSEYDTGGAGIEESSVNSLCRGLERRRELSSLSPRLAHPRCSRRVRSLDPTNVFNLAGKQCKCGRLVMGNSVLISMRWV